MSTLSNNWSLCDTFGIFFGWWAVNSLSPGLSHIIKKKHLLGCIFFPIFLWVHSLFPRCISHHVVEIVLKMNLNWRLFILFSGKYTSYVLTISWNWIYTFLKVFKVCTLWQSMDNKGPYLISIISAFDMILRNTQYHLLFSLVTNLPHDYYFKLLRWLL